MDWNIAASMARTLMNEHGLTDIPFESSNGRRVAGECCYFVRRIGQIVLEETVTKIRLSRCIVELNEPDIVRDTILHEIAHAKAGIAAGHGWKWQQVARSIGARPERCCGEGVIAPIGKYQATCSCEGRTHSMYRQPKRAKRCSICKTSLQFVRTAC